MKFTYTPEGGEPRSWDYRPAKMLNVESEAIERVTGWTYQQFGEQFMAGSSTAYHALLWVFLRRATPGLQYDAVQFTYDEIEVEWDAKEKRALVDAMKALPDLTDQQRVLLDDLLADPDLAEPEVAEDPKG